jgi:hypothetical protein
VRTIAIGFALVAGACARRGELLQYHRIEPAPAITSPQRGVRVQRVSSVSMPGGRDRPSTLWIELELDNHGSEAWQLDCAALQLEHGTCAGFGEYPSVAYDHKPQPAVQIGAGATRRIWARFDKVHTQAAGAAAVGVDTPAPIVLHVDNDRLALADPARGAPLWTASNWPYFGTFGFGFGFGFGTTDGLGVDVTLTAHRRFGEFDVGIVGAARAGVDVQPMQGMQAMLATGFASLGGGLTSGYTLHLGRRFFLRPAISAIVARAGHGMIETTPVWVGGELQLGFARNSLYPFRERTTSYTFGWYVRGEGRVASLSEIDEPFAFGISLGLTLRGGS